MTFFCKVSASITVIRSLPYYSWVVVLHALWIGGIKYTLTITNVSAGTEKTFEITKGAITLLDQQLK